MSGSRGKCGELNAKRRNNLCFLSRANGASYLISAEKRIGRECSEGEIDQGAAESASSTPYLAWQWNQEDAAAALQPLPAEHAVKKSQKWTTAGNGVSAVTSSPFEKSSSRADVGRPNDFTFVICLFAASISARNVLTRARYTYKGMGEQRQPHALGFTVHTAPFSARLRA